MRRSAPLGAQSPWPRANKAGDAAPETVVGGSLLHTRSLATRRAAVPPRLLDLGLGADLACRASTGHSFKVSTRGSCGTASAPMPAQRCSLSSRSKGCGNEENI